MSTGSAWNAIYPPTTGTIGSVLVSSGTGNATWTDGTIYSTTNTNLEIKKRLDAIEDQLLILRPALELHDKYPALKEAYDAYLLVLKMVDGPKGETE